MSGAETAAGWNYHPTELMVRPRGLESVLARRLATNLSQFHQVALVRHGPSYLARPLEQSGIGTARVDGVWAVVGANGQDCLFSHDGHFDLLQQRTLLVDVDLAVVEGRLAAKAPTILELEPDGGGIEDLSQETIGSLVACVGPRRPGQIPPGGVPWFRPEDEEGLVDLCMDHLDRSVRKRPVWGLVLASGRSDRPDMAAKARILAEHCDRCFIEAPADPSWSAMGWEIASNACPSLGRLGTILACQETGAHAAFLIVDESTSSTETELVERLVALRDPFRTATVYRGSNTHLPAPFPGIWEPKSRIRILQASAAGLACPERILVHSRIQLLDRGDSNSG